MGRMIHMLLTYLPRLSITLAIIISFVGCGSGGNGSEGPSRNSSSNSSDAVTVRVSGLITYDYVPHNPDFVGLNYAATEQRPVRGAVVEILDGSDQIKVTTASGSDGTYSVLVKQDALIKVRVKAQLLNISSPSWDFKVTDNTSDNALYVLDGALVSSGKTDSTRNLHASSGWGGFDYSSPRSAAPFAILDNVYIGLMRLMAAGNTRDMHPLELRWSTKNSAADGDYTIGEIGTSFYDGDAIYILGDADNDIDEYDAHVLLHEWGHYIEAELFRSDSIGGDHSDGKFLDVRVAMSEGFANAFSGMMIDTANYSDASGVAQSSGFTFDIARKNRPNKGYFSEGSIGSILYNFYTSGENKIANDFKPIFDILSSLSYRTNDALTSIYLFYSELKNQYPSYLAMFQALMQEQTIWGEDEYATNESNSGGLAIQLPIYKKITINGDAVNVCSSNQYGEQNRLGNSQFVKLNVAQARNYSIDIVKTIDNKITTKPEFIVYSKGVETNYMSNTLADKVSGGADLTAGNYILEVYDKVYRDSDDIDVKNTSCFDVQVKTN